MQGDLAMAWIRGSDVSSCSLTTHAARSADSQPALAGQLVAGANPRRTMTISTGRLSPSAKASPATHFSPRNLAGRLVEVDLYAQGSIFLTSTLEPASSNCRGINRGRELDDVRLQAQVVGCFRRLQSQQPAADHRARFTCWA